MESQIERQLSAGQGDPDYWEAVLSRLQIHAAKARLRELQAELLAKRLSQELANIDVAKAMGWKEEDEEEEQLSEQERLGEG